MAKIKTVLALASVAALAVTAPALALSVSLGASGNADASIGSGIETGVDASARTSAHGSVHDASNAAADIAIPLVITRADISAGDEQPAIAATGSVHTKSELSDLIYMNMHADAGLTSVDTATDHVAVTHEEPGLLLGLFPIMVETTVTTDASGNVTIAEPWWDLLATSDTTKLHTSVQASVDKLIGTNTSSNAQLSVAQQAQIIAAIESAMSAAAQASGSGAASIR